MIDEKCQSAYITPKLQQLHVSISTSHLFTKQITAEHPLPHKKQLLWALLVMTPTKLVTTTTDNEGFLRHKFNDAKNRDVWSRDCRLEKIKGKQQATRHRK
jgi:hypothetical protein